MKTLNVFAELNKIPSDKKVEYIRTVLKRGDDETISLEGFKKQLSSLSVTEVGNFDNCAINLLPILLDATVWRLDLGLGVNFHFLAR